MLCEVLKDNKVQTKGVRFDAQARTALAFVTLRDDGEREFMFYRNPSADMLFQTDELDIELLNQVLFPQESSVRYLLGFHTSTSMFSCWFSFILVCGHSLESYYGKSK